MTSDVSASFLKALEETHRGIDRDIAALQASPGHDQLELARLKKKKLRIRDEIARAADAAIPDLIA